MKKLIYLGAFLFVAFSCSVEDVNTDVQEKNLETLVVEEMCGDVVTKNYDNDLGYVEVTNSATTLYVKVTSNVAGALMNSRFAWSEDFAGFESNNGTLPPAKMDEKMDEHGVTTFTYQVPLSEITTDCILIAVRSIFKANQGEHWVGDFTAGQAEWKYFEYCIQTCPPPPPVMICETAFMFGNKTFYGAGSLNIGNNWGWALYYTGGEGSFSKTLWAGAGKNNTSKATAVGTVTTTISGNDVTVRIDMAPGYEDALNVTHIYFSSVAPTTAAPGQYGNTDDNPYDGKEYPFVRNGNFYLIVHAEVCQEE
ncbi:MAG: hypothetical protein ABJ092_15255 [Gillisia sp.]